MAFQGQVLLRTEIYVRGSAPKTLNPEILDTVDFRIEIVLGDEHVRGE